MRLKPHIDAVLNAHDALSVFGLILYTDRHPHIVKVMRDDDYWREFNAISGKNFAIFSAKPLQGDYRSPEFGPGQMGMMMQIWNEPAANESLLHDFNLSSTKDLPTFLVFAQLPDSTILQCQIHLTDKDEASAYSRLKEVITVVADAAAKISDQYKENTADVFQAFQMQVGAFKEREAIIKTIQWLPFVSRVRRWFIEASS